ncbi:MAG: hypothetical protein MZV63_31770 [Marinilabiliales bacterium]|nr:hypothetical protein [Marinilabiliales bacterium]
MSGELLSSKVIVVEEEPAVRGIPSAPTSVVGAIGITQRGPDRQGHALHLVRGVPAGLRRLHAQLRPGARGHGLLRERRQHALGGARRSTTRTSPTRPPPPPCAVSPTCWPPASRRPRDSKARAPARSCSPTATASSSPSTAARTRKPCSTARPRPSSRSTSGPFAVAAGDTLVVQIDDGPEQTLVFPDLGERPPRPPSVAAAINERILGAKAVADPVAGLSDRERHRGHRPARWR